MLEIAGRTPLLITKKAVFLQNFGFLQCPQNMGYIQWPQQQAFYNTRKFKFTTCGGFVLDRPCLLGQDLELLAMFSLVWSSGYLPQILSVHFYMTEPLVYACMPLQGWKLLGIGYDLMCKQRGCFSLGVNHRCCVNRVGRTWSRAQLFDVSKKGKPTNRN